MMVVDYKSEYKVMVSRDDVDKFNSRWPGSTLKGPQTFTFCKRNGDLIDRTGKGDGSEALALSQDAQSYGKRRLGL